MLGPVIDQYLEHIGFSTAPPVTVAGLSDLMEAHLVAVPFENLDVYFQRGISVDPEVTVAKVLAGRGGWCFELNGAFALLLQALGFEVALLGAAVLLSGPNRLVDHLTLEVTLDRPYLVDVGFGDTFTRPLPLNTTGELDGGSGRFGFMGSPQGTTLVRFDDGIPVPQFRFRRVALTMDDFAPASERLYGDPESHFRAGPVVTRLTGSGADRVTLSADRLRQVVDGERTDTPVEGPRTPAWDQALADWFDIQL